MFWSMAPQVWAGPLGPRSLSQCSMRYPTVGRSDEPLHPWPFSPFCYYCYVVQPWHARAVRIPYIMHNQLPLVGRVLSRNRWEKMLTAIQKTVSCGFNVTGSKNHLSEVWKLFREERHEPLSCYTIGVSLIYLEELQWSHDPPVWLCGGTTDRL